MHMTQKMKLTQLTEMLQELNIESLEGVTIEGDIELNITGGVGLNPALAYALGSEISQISLHMANIGRMLGFPAEQLFASAFGMSGMPEAQEPSIGTTPRIQELLASKFEVAKMSNWNNPIQEVTLGATEGYPVRGDNTYVSGCK